MNTCFGCAEPYCLL